MFKRNKRYLLFALPIVIIVIFFIAVFLTPKTSFEALKRELYLYNEPVWQVSKIIGQVNASQGHLLFYYNANGGINCATIKKIIFGYKVSKISAELSPTSESLRVGLHASAYESGKKWTAYGVIYDNNVKQVEWGGISFNFFNTDNENLTLIYSIGKEKMPTGLYHIYDIDGNELERHI